MNESFPGSGGEAIDAAEQQRLAAIRERIETVGEQYYIDQYGLGIDELSIQVEFGSYRGSLLDAIGDEGAGPTSKCPVGESIADAKLSAEAEETNDALKLQAGIDAVQQTLDGFSIAAGKVTDASGNKIKRFDVTVGEKTRDSVKKKWLSPRLISNQ